MTEIKLTKRGQALYEKEKARREAAKEIKVKVEEDKEEQNENN